MKSYEFGTSGFVVEETRPTWPCAECGRGGLLRDPAGAKCRTCGRETASVPGPPHRSYWYGPRGFAVTWGGLDYSVAVFASRPKARSEFEEFAGVWRPGTAAVRVADVEERLAAEGAVWAPTMIHGPTGKPISWQWTTPEYDVRTPEGRAHWEAI